MPVDWQATTVMSSMFAPKKEKELFMKALNEGGLKLLNELIIDTAPEGEPRRVQRKSRGSPEEGGLKLLDELIIDTAPEGEPRRVQRKSRGFRRGGSSCSTSSSSTPPWKVSPGGSRGTPE
eukprot:730032-Prorocentrum_minimum.AAC.1